MPLNPYSAVLKTETYGPAHLVMLALILRQPPGDSMTYFAGVAGRGKCN